MRVMEIFFFHTKICLCLGSKPRVAKHAHSVLYLLSVFDSSIICCFSLNYSYSSYRRFCRHRFLSMMKQGCKPGTFHLLFELHCLVKRSSYITIPKLQEVLVHTVILRYDYLSCEAPSC